MEIHTLYSISIFSTRRPATVFGRRALATGMAGDGGNF